MNNSRFAPPLMRHSEGPVLMGGEQNDDFVSRPMEYPGREQPYERRFSPYDFNGGTVAGVSGDDYLVIAADTRMSSGFEILSRNTTKLHQLNPNAILGSSGCKTDMDQLRSVLDIKAKVRQISRFLDDFSRLLLVAVSVILKFLCTSYKYSLCALDLPTQPSQVHVGNIHSSNVE